MSDKTDQAKIDFANYAGLALVILAIGLGFGGCCYLVDAGSNKQPCKCQEQAK